MRTQSQNSYGFKPPLRMLAPRLCACLFLTIILVRPTLAQEPTPQPTPVEIGTREDEKDPFAMLKRTPVLPLHTEKQLAFKGAAFLKLQHNSYAQTSLPTSEPKATKSPSASQNKAIAHARFSLSNTIDQAEQWRWLYRAYASTSDFPEGDGVVGKNLRTDELFIDWKSDQYFATLGKRRVNWGHAQGFTIVNVLAPNRDPLNPDFETEGQPMLWLNQRGKLSTDLIYTRGNYRGDTAGASKIGGDKARWGLRVNLPTSDIDFAFYHYDGVNYADGRPFERMLGASFSANALPGLSIYGELAQYSHNYRHYYGRDSKPQIKDKVHRKFVLGALIDLGEKSSLFTEILRNDLGFNTLERRAWWTSEKSRQSAADSFSPLGMNRGYLLIAYRKEYLEKYSASLSLVIAADRSSNTRLEAKYLWSDYVDVKAIFTRSAGKIGSEFRSNPYAKQFEIEFSTHF